MLLQGFRQHPDKLLAEMEEDDFFEPIPNRIPLNKFDGF